MTPNRLMKINKAEDYIPPYRQRDIKYIDGNVNHGIEYDWKFLFKKYKELGCPSIYYNPCKCPLASCKYFVEYSMRSIGKTTGWLLLGILMNWYYGTEIQYIRQNIEEISPKIAGTLFDAVVTNDYIVKITGGRWTAVYYDRRKWYFLKIDETGQVVERCPEPFCSMLNIKDHSKYKSGYNAPTGDLIIFDEFIGDYYLPDEFVMFCDLTKTIIRDRRSPVIVMLANTIDKESPYYSELEIYENVKTLPAGEHTTKVTERGTGIYIEYITADKQKQKILDVINSLFYGFKNKGLGSITGEDWAIKPRQRIPQGEFTYIAKNLYIWHNERYIRLDIINHESLGICMYVHWATRVYDDSMILTLHDRTDARYQYKTGTYDVESMIHKFRDQNRVYYASNDVASFFDNYLRECQKRF